MHERLFLMMEYRALLRSYRESSVSLKLPERKTKTKAVKLRGLRSRVPCSSPLLHNNILSISQSISLADRLVGEKLSYYLHAIVGHACTVVSYAEIFINFQEAV